MRGLIPALVIARPRAAPAGGGGPGCPRSGLLPHVRRDVDRRARGAEPHGPGSAGSAGAPPDERGDLAEFYTADGPKIFHRSFWHKLRTLWGFIAPKYGLGPLEEAVTRRIGTEARLADAPARTGRSRVRHDRPRAVLLQALAGARGPVREIARWSDAALATSAAPTYFPSHEVDGHALVDGGVFAANPTIAAVVEALKRRGDEPHDLSPDDLLVISIGTGLHETDYTPGGGEPAGASWAGSSRRTASPRSSPRSWVARPMASTTGRRRS